MITMTVREFDLKEPKHGIKMAFETGDDDADYTCLVTLHEDNRMGIGYFKRDDPEKDLLEHQVFRTNEIYELAAVLQAILEEIEKT